MTKSGCGVAATWPAPPKAFPEFGREKVDELARERRSISESEKQKVSINRSEVVRTKIAGRFRVMAIVQSVSDAVVEEEWHRVYADLEQQGVSQRC